MADKKLVDYRFDAATEQAVKYAETESAKLITEITAETEANIRNLIATAIKDGMPPYDAARAIVPLIGLTSAQGQAALKYREQLIDSGLSLDKVNEKTDKYADKLLDDRADRIARTEVMDSLNAGQDAAWVDAQEQGYLSEDATKEWIVTPDDLLCPECEAYDGAVVPVGEEFDEGDPPLHPSCRCTIGISTP